MSDVLGRHDATALVALVRQGDATPRDLVDAAIARIERLNPRLNAVIHPRFARARAEADALGTTPRGPLHGLPFLLKDIMGSSAGDPLHFGTTLLRDAGFVAPHDAWLTRKLKDAGAIIVGRTNAPELGTLPTTEPDAYGPTRNPWNPDHSAGGSSGGSAAAVASGMVPAAHANDGGGSIRIPASACGLVGLKPTRGRISLGPDLGDGMGGLVHEGFVTRTVRDTALLLDVAQGAMPGDPYTAPPPARPYVQEVGADPGRLRVGVMTHVPGNMLALGHEAHAAVNHAARLLGDAGHHVEGAHPAALDEHEAGQHLTTMFASQAAHLLQVMGMIVGRPVGPDDVDPLNWALAELSRGMTVPQYLAAVDWIHAYGRRLAAWWADGFDLLLTPTMPEPPAPLGFFRPSRENPVEAGMRASHFASFTAPFNMSGQPAVSLPLHWTPDGLPVGVQLVAATGREDLLLRVAAQLESAAPWADRLPTVHA
jgi:amidase